MSRVTDDRPRPKAVVFDLDEVLLDRREAWRYALEQAVGATTGRRVDASGLVEEYQGRPVTHAVAVLIEGFEERVRCQQLWAEMFYRSGMKRLLVHDGVGVGLDRVVAAGIEVGAVSREPHETARKQIESTGLDRFVTVLSATPRGSEWDVAGRLADCLAFLGHAAGECAYVSGQADDLKQAAGSGLREYGSAWAGADEGWCCLGSAADVCEELLATWGTRA